MLLYEAPHVVQTKHRAAPVLAAPARGAPRAGCRRTRRFSCSKSELDRAIGTLHHKAQAFEVQLGEFGPTRLEKAEAFRFFRELVNYDPAVVDAARLAYDTHLDYFVVGLGRRVPPRSPAWSATAWSRCCR